ncbi:MAG: Ldh family oxidoreductase [Acidimicrobiia bacterium]|nr:Ldh family oxidoreductase [Acidimicrobiia bacterium]
MPHVHLDQIESVTAQALLKHGAPTPVAASVAHAVRVAESNGNKICGLYYVDSYCTQLRTGRVLGDVTPEVTHDKPGSVRVDAKFGFAQWAFSAGFSTAVEAARANGTCGFSIEHSHTCTSLGYFTEQFARQGLLALGATNSTARVSPPGGSVPILGTNPMAMAVPGRDGSVAFQFDYSTSAVALGKITMAAAAGESIPIGWAVDADGNDTTDPNEALKGSLVSAGGYKGYGLGLMVEVLASALTGSLSSTQIPPLKAPEGPHHDIGQFYLVIDPAAFGGDGFFDRVDALADAVDAQPGARLPGSSRSEPDTVELEDDVWASIQALAEV